MIVVAVSAGVDSMVLLDYLYKQNHDIIIAHVNYQKRKDSFLDAETIKKYIMDKNIRFEELIVTKDMYTSTNFQAQARHIRYDFFKKIASKYQTNEVYVAHHKDDFLETFLFKKERKGLYDYYGIKEITQYNGMNINRPLISMFKEDIEKYAQENNIPFHEDSSNYELDYTRNIIRHRLINLNVAEKEALYQEAIALNEIIESEIAFVNNNIVKKIAVETFNEWTLNIKRRWLFKIINKYDITTKHLDDIIVKICLSSKFKVTFLDTTIIKVYDIIYILDKLYYEYNYYIENEKDYESFLLKWQNDYDCSFVKKEYDYPFIIRNYRKEDLLELNMDYKKFRLKIKKKKIPFFLRECLPIIEKDDKVIDIIY